MGAILLAPVYILINFYVVRWMIRWMGACHRLFQTMAFRVSFVGIYIILATALLTGFLVKKPLSLHRILKHIGNYFLGTFIYILLVIAVVDFGRLILKYVFHAPFIGQAEHLCDHRTDLHGSDHCSQHLRNSSCRQCENHAL